jgi:hypothetical protein
MSIYILKEVDRKQREENLEAAKGIKITEDKSLPKSTVVCSIEFHFKINI